MDILNINTGLLPIKAHFFLYYAENSPINPFLSTIAKQRGYSSSVFGNILTLLLLLTIVVKPLTGYITDRWKCRRTVFLCAILLNGLLTPTLYLIPGATSSTGELSNADTFGSLQFWWFATVVILRMILFMVGEVLQETICIRILANSPINPFLSTIAKQRGYSSSIIGNILTFLLLLNIVVKPLTGYITDRWKSRRTVFLCTILLNGLITPTLYLIPGATSSTGECSDAETFGSLQFWLFTFVVTLRMILFMIGEVLQETICIRILDGDTVKFGMQRLWGAAGWGVMSVIAGGSIDWYSSGLAQKNHLPGYLLSAASFFVDFVVAFNLKVPETDGPTTNILKDVKIVLKNAKVCVFLVWATIGGIFTAYIWFYFIWYLDDLANIYHPERKSMISSIEGFSLTIECLGGEVPFFYLSGHLIKRTGHMTAFSISFAMFALRFLLYSIIRDPLWVLPVEMLNGITFGLSYIAGISYSAKIAPVGSEGTVQGLFAMTFQGFGASLGATLAGYTFSHLGSVMAFRLIGFSALIVCVIQIAVNHFINRNRKLII